MIDRISKIEVEDHFSGSLVIDAPGLNEVEVAP
jgi:hypothetical protein